MECGTGDLGIRRLPADGTPVPKHVRDNTMNCVSWFVFYYILLSAFVGQSTE